MKITLAVLSLNELEGMKVIMPRIKKEWVDQILVVDGGSTDGTVEWARENGYEVLCQKKKGLRNGYVEALEYVDSDVIITFSPDGNSDPDRIPDLVSRMKEGYDMVIVSRYAEGAKSEDDSLFTRFGNWLFTTMINVLHGGKYTDCLVMYRGWRTDVYRELDADKTLTKFEERFYPLAGSEPLLCIRMAKRKKKCADIPGDEPARIGGETKARFVPAGMCILFEIIRELFVWR
jgi:glycosyltransferase involved in cell wall biosynthesis